MNQATTDKTSQYSLKKAVNYVRDLLNEKLPEHLTFHDWDHTQMVMEAVAEIGKESGCKEEELEILTLAALFHDTGYTQTYENHETASKQIAKAYLESVNYPEVKAEQVSRLIEATRIKTDAKTKLEKILVDADLAHLGKKKYRKRAKALLKELNEGNEVALIDLEWSEQNIDFMENHDYHTDAAEKLYEKRKEKNLQKLKGHYKELKEESSISENKAARMIFKTALRNHIDLTSIADQKANIMLTINAVILSLGMPLFPAFLMDKPMLKYPAILFLVTCAVTMILATLATRPVSSDGKTKMSSLFSGKANLFFFGNFYKLQLEEYHTAVKKVMSDREIMDKNIMNDLYYLGNALGVKYKMLRICYTVFATGLIITLISVAVSYALTS